MRFKRVASFLFNEEQGHYVLIVMFSLLAHGLLLLNDGVYWDGWLIYAGKFLDRWDLIRGIYADRGGLPIYTAFHWVMYSFPSFVFGYKLVAYLFILFSALFVYRIVNLIIGRVQVSLFVALIALTYPANQATVELIVIPYLFSYFLFWLGCLLLLLAFEKKGHSAIWWHAGAVISLLLSFRMYSLLVFFYGFLLILFLARRIEKPGESILVAGRNYCRAYWAYLILPVLFWLGNAWLFPPSGPYENSDSFIWGTVMFPLALNYFTNALFGQFAASLANLVNPIALLIVLVGALVFAKNLDWNPDIKKQPSLRGRHLPLTAGGIVFFLLGVLPYVAVGRSTLLHGWSTRNAILIAIPTAMVIVGAAWGVLQKMDRKTKPRAVKAAVFVLSSLLILFTIETAKFYLSWQLRAIKDHSVILNLSHVREEAQDVSVFFVSDEFRVGGEDEYSPHEYFGMFAKVWPEGEKIGLDTKYYSFEEYFLTGNETREELFRFWYPNLDWYGCQAELHISLGSVKLDASIYPKYFYYRYLARERLDAFLSTVTELDIVPIDSQLATNCTP